MRGFSLLELILALAITAIIGKAGFEIFRQNEHVFENQNAISAVQQNARAVIFQINDDIRRAGQGVPVYSSSFDATGTEFIAAVLSGSDSTHLAIREDFPNVQTDVMSAPVDYILNASQTVLVSDTTSFYNELGTTTPTGRFAYVWGSGLNGCWSWVRALIVTISNVNRTITVIPQQMGQACHVAPSTVHLTSPAAIALEQAASIYLNNGSIWRTTAADMTNPTSPVWNAATEIGRDFDAVAFTYYDANDNPIDPTSLAARLAIVRIDTRVQTTSGLGFNLRGYPVNCESTDVSKRYFLGKSCPALIARP